MSLKNTLNKLSEKINQYKWAFLGLIVFATVVLALTFLQKRIPEETTLTPVIKTEEEAAPIPSQNDFFIESAYPPSGKTQTISKYTHIIFSFSKPIMTGDIKVTVKPYIMLKKEFSEDKKQLYIYPNEDPWVDQMEYTITITNVRSTEGEKLDNEIIKHIYYNEDPGLIPFKNGIGI